MVYTPRMSSPLLMTHDSAKERIKPQPWSAALPGSELRRVSCSCKRKPCNPPPGTAREGAMPPAASAAAGGGGTSSGSRGKWRGTDETKSTSGRRRNKRGINQLYQARGNMTGLALARESCLHIITRLNHCRLKTEGTIWSKITAQGRTTLIRLVLSGH